jgi:SEC-C motif-containing protein
MRSRYSAFVLRLPEYLLETWHASTRPSTLTLDAGVRWLGLDVKKAVGAGDADYATVEFVARSRHGGGPAHRQHELSRFVREDGRWFYLDGDVR